MGTEQTGKRVEQKWRRELCVLCRPRRTSGLRLEGRYLGKSFSLVHFACGKFTVWFHLSLMGEPDPITRLNCELHSSPQPSPQPFQRGPRENGSSVCVLPQQRGRCNQVALCFSEAILEQILDFKMPVWPSFMFFF